MRFLKPPPPPPSVHYSSVSLPYVTEVFIESGIWSDHLLSLSLIVLMIASCTWGNYRPPPLLSLSTQRYLNWLRDKFNMGTAKLTQDLYVYRYKFYIYLKRWHHDPRWFDQFLYQLIQLVGIGRHRQRLTDIFIVV